MPECEYNLYHCATVLAKAPKSRATTSAMYAAKARRGSLAGTEERELEDYRAVATILEFLKSKARLRLKPPC